MDAVTSNLKKLLLPAVVACAVLWPQPGGTQTGPSFDHLILEEVQAVERIPWSPYLLQTPESHLSLIGSLFPFDGYHRTVVIDSTRGLLYAQESPAGGSDPTLSIAVVDLKTLTLRNRIALGSDTRLFGGIVVDPVGNRLFVGNWDSGLISSIDPVSGEVQQVYQCPSHCGVSAYSAATNQLVVIMVSAVVSFSLVDLGNLSAPLTPLSSLPLDTRVESFVVLNDESRTVYVGTIPWSFQKDLSASDGVVHAFDIDPGSPTFTQIIWTTAGSSKRAESWLQPALDRARQRLYVPDAAARLIRVFNAARGADLHQPLQEISVAGYFPEDQGAGAYRTIVPEVDPVTGLVYAVLSDDWCVWIGGCDLGSEARVIAITPEGSVAGAASLPNFASVAGGHELRVDPGTRRMVVIPWLTGGGGSRAGQFALLEDLRPSMLATEPDGGTPVTVTAAEATITFDSVSSPGTTSIEPASITGLDVTLPGQFSIDGGLAYEVSTTATVSGPIVLCFSAAHIDDPSAFETLHVLHAESGGWVDRTISRDYETRTICAQTDSLSPFAIARRTAPEYSPRLLYTIDRAYRAGSTVPLKLQVLNWAGENVSASALPLKAVSLTRSSSDAALNVEDAGSANPDQDFRYDPELEGYIFNLSTQGLTAGTYMLTADVGPRGRYIHLPFSVR